MLAERYIHRISIIVGMKQIQYRKEQFMDKESIAMKVQEIEEDLDLLRQKRVYELVKVPGVPKCSTLADRTQVKLDNLVSAYEELIEHQRESADQEQFRLLSGLLKGLAKEIADLSKKQPDGLVNAFKVGQINRVLKPLKEIMAGEPSAKFLDLVSEVEGKAEKSRNSYSDVAVILSQYTQACEKYRVKYFARVTDSKF